MSTVLGQPIPLGGEGAVKYSTAQTLTTEQKEQAQKNIGVTWPCNPNLLDNWYFLNPVNQRGRTSYTRQDYTIDRWYHRDGNSTGTVTLTDSGITLSRTDTSGAGARAFNMRVDNLEQLLGKTVTISALVAENTHAANEVRISLDAADSVEFNSKPLVRAYPPTTNSTILVTGTGTIPTSTTYPALNFGVFSGTVPGTVTILAVKLELGTGQTLAHQDAEGNWVLNEIPDYHTELLKCIQSTADPADTYANKVVATKPIRTVVSLPTASWTGDDPYSQTVTISGGTATHAADLLPSAEVAAQMVEDGVQYMCIENNDGTFTAKAVGAAPTVDLSVQVLLTEVAT